VALDVGDVAQQELGPAAHGLDRGEGALGVLIALQVGDGDVEAAPGQRLGDGGANAAAAAGYQGDGIACGIGYIRRSPLGILYGRCDRRAGGRRLWLN